MCKKSPTGAFVTRMKRGHTGAAHGASPPLASRGGGEPDVDAASDGSGGDADGDAGCGGGVAGGGGAARGDGGSAPDNGGSASAGGAAVVCRPADTAAARTPASAALRAWPSRARPSAAAAAAEPAGGPANRRRSSSVPENKRVQARKSALRHTPCARTGSGRPHRGASMAAQSPPGAAGAASPPSERRADTELPNDFQRLQIAH